MNISLTTLHKYAKNPEQIAIGKNAGEPVFYWFGDLLPYSWADDCEDGPNHTGWFTYADGTCYKDGSGKSRGVVIQLPSVPGFPDGRYLAGYWCGDNGEFVVWPELYKDEKDAAWMADEHAETFAELAREDNERYEAMMLTEMDYENKLLEVQKAFALRHRAKFGGPEHVREVIEELREARENLTEATTAYERG